jgi:hypothetical protein
MKIGLYLKRQDWHDPHVASDRIRGEWIMKYCSDMEEWHPGKKYEVIILHNSPVREIPGDSTIRIADICDPIWTIDAAGFKKLHQISNAIVTATDELARQVRQFTPKMVVTIGDGHYFPFYETRAWNPHSGPAKTAVWFGYAANAVALTPLLPALQRHHLAVKVIAEKSPFPPGKIQFIPWRIDTYIHEISKADFAVLPVTQPHKSNNKDITALLSGIPVAKTEADIARLMDPAQRQADMIKAPEIVSRHNARDRAKDYLNLIHSLRASQAW